MSNNNDLVHLPLHAEAEKAIRMDVKDHLLAVMMQAKVIAHKSKADLVLRCHVDEAIHRLSSSRRARLKELLLIAGSAFFGAFVQGFVSELAAPRIGLLIGYVVLGFLGAFMVFLGLGTNN